MLDERDLILGIDTATSMASVALYSPGGVLAEASWLSSMNHTVELMPRIANMMREQGFSPPDLKCVAVAQGPGSFTGLRIGMSLGKGLALALGIPLIGVSTLEVTAYPHRWQPLPICAVVQAGRGRVAAALFRAERGKLKRLEDPHITTVRELCEGIKERTLFCGELTEEERSHISGSLREDLAVMVSSALSLRRAGYLAELGWERLRAASLESPDLLQELIDPAALAPIYLHQPGG